MQGLDEPKAWTLNPNGPTMQGLDEPKAWTLNPNGPTMQGLDEPKAWTLNPKQDRGITVEHRAAVALPSTGAGGHR